MLKWGQNEPNFTVAVFPSHDTTWMPEDMLQIAGTVTA